MKNNKRYVTIAMIAIVAVIVVGVLIKACTNTPAPVNNTTSGAQTDTESSNGTQNMLVGAAVGYVVGTAINNANNRSNTTKPRLVPAKTRPLPKTIPNPKTITKTSPVTKNKTLIKPVKLTKPNIRKPSVTKRKNTVTSRSKPRSKR